MKLTLRKANAVQLTINDIIKSMDFSTTIKLNEFQDHEMVIAKAHEKFKADVVRRTRLLESLKEIRDLVGSANSNGQIDRRLTEIAHLEKQIQFFNQLIQNVSIRENSEVIKGKLEKIRNRKEEYRIYQGDEIVTGLLQDSDIEGFKDLIKNLKKSKQKLQDEILELNIRTEIDISKEAEDILFLEGVI